MRGIESGPVEQPRVFPLEHARPEVPANRIVGLVAQHRRRKQQTDRQRVVHETGTAHGPNHKQQRITRQKRHDHHPGLHKNDQKQQAIDPEAVVLDKRLQVLVHVQDEVDQKGDKFHGCAVCRGGWVRCPGCVTHQ